MPGGQTPNAFNESAHRGLTATMYMGTIIITPLNEEEGEAREYKSIVLRSHS